MAILVVFKMAATENTKKYITLLVLLCEARWMHWGDLHAASSGLFKECLYCGI